VQPLEKLGLIVFASIHFLNLGSQKKCSRQELYATDLLASTIAWEQG
jgi:hypothetical protein